MTYASKDRYSLYSWTWSTTTWKICTHEEYFPETDLHNNSANIMVELKGRASLRPNAVQLGPTPWRAPHTMWLQLGSRAVILQLLKN